MHFSLSTVLALGALHTFGVYAQDCINTCVENVRPTVGCADPADASCVCVSNDFVKGVAECARAPECAAADDAITNGISNGFCVGQQVPAFPGATATPVESAATSEAAETASETPAAPENTAAETTPAALPESSEPPVTSEAVATSEAPEATPTDPAKPAETSATEEASASSTDASNSSTATEAADATATSDSTEDKDEDESAGGGMSGGAKAGVGIGVTIGVLALLGIAGFFWKKRQNQRNLPRGNMDDMSPPMAARDRSYPAPDQGSIGEKNGYDLELMSHRYEDMLPREEPRHMV